MFEGLGETVPIVILVWEGHLLGADVNCHFVAEDTQWFPHYGLSIEESPVTADMCCTGQCLLSCVGTQLCSNVMLT